MDKLLAITGSLTLIIAIIWWFFGKRHVSTLKAAVENGTQTAMITVDGGYTPTITELAAGVPTELIFLRKDPSTCFEEVVLPDFGIKTKLPINQPLTVVITPQKPGEYTYACGMNMFFGKLVVK